MFLIAGQSNTLAGKTKSAAIDIAGPRLYQWGRHGENAGKIVGGGEPLEHNEASVRQTEIGFAVAFARDFYIPQALTAGRDVLLVAAGKGSTSFSNGWAVGGSLYLAAIASANAAMASHPENAFKGILWHQGESDTPATEAEYAADLDPMIAGMRAGITGATNVPFIVGGMVPAWVAADVANRQGVQDALIATPGRVSNTGYANPSLPTVLENDADADLIHYGAEDQRLLGGRYWTALEPLL